MRITRGFGPTLSGTAINFGWSVRSRHSTWRGVARFPTLLFKGTHVNDRFGGRIDLQRELNPSLVTVRTPETPWDDDRTPLATPLAAYNDAMYIYIRFENVTTDSLKARKSIDVYNTASSAK